jgi:tripartite-type tricarboxylate transporter receptor subunit TctC
LGISSSKPHPLLPEVPPLRTLNLGEIEIDMWYGVLAPRGTPKEFMQRLNQELKSILALPEVKSAFETQGMTPTHSSAEEFRSLIDKDAVRWAKLIQAQAIKAD